MMAMADNLVKPAPFFIEFAETFVHGDLLLKQENEDPPLILFLHGAMLQEDRTRFLLLRQVLLNQYKLPSCAFDFIGHGSTGGELLGSSLQQRTAQATDVIDGCFDCQPFSIVASGMGAYTAFKLLSHFPVNHLVLMVPAVYSHAAYQAEFGPAFSSIIRQPESWDQSDAWDHIAMFKGNLSMLVASQDKVIPPEIITCIDKHAVVSSGKRVMELPCSHDLMAYINKNPRVMADVSRLIANTLAGNNG